MSLRLYEQELDRYITQAIGEAKAYVKNNWNSGKLNGATPEEIAAIKEFLSAVPHPYDQPKIRSAIKSIFKATLESAKPAEMDRPRHITYLSGAYGSETLLKGQGTQELKELLAVSAYWNIPSIKHGLEKHAGIKISSGQEPYGKWRGLVSGIDIALAKFAEDKRLHFAIDNSLAPIDQASIDITLKDFERHKEAGALHVFAVALTPEEAAAQHPENAKEAGRTAQDFHSFLPDILAHVPNVTLLDRQMEVAYRQRDGKTEVFSADKLHDWSKGTRPDKQVPVGLRYQR